MGKYKQRNSSIELLKIIALFFIVLCHSLPLYKLEGNIELTGYLNLRQGTSNVQQLLLIIFSHLGQIGNALFIVPSAYFLLDKNEVKKNKIVQYMLDTFIVSIIYLVIFIVAKVELPLRYIISSLFPITFSFYWFITCYILLYAIHPWLNHIIRKLEKKQLFTTNLFFFLLYCCISFVLNGKYYYSQLIGFIVYYFFIAYIKLYLPNFSNNKATNQKILISSICGFITLIVSTNYIGVQFSFASYFVGDIETFINPFIIGLAISVFNLCNLKNWNSKIINRISSTSLLVFVISNNMLVCSFVKPILFENIYLKLSYKYISIICIAIASATLIISILISLIYMKLIQRIVSRYCEKIVSVLENIISKLFAYIDNMEINGNSWGAGKL